MVGIPGIDRVAMERERLARQAAKANDGSVQTSEARTLKRDRSISPPPISRPSKALKLQNTTTASTPSDKPLRIFKSKDIIDLVDSPVQPKKPQPSTLQNTITPSPTPALQYPNGILKKTWALGHPRTPSDIKIEEVLEKHTLRTALLSAFQWDVEWILSKCNLQQTKFIFVMQAKTQAIRDQYQQETEYMGKILRLCFPNMDGNVNCMHSKLMLLFHGYKLRVVVPTANLVSYDWGETGIMENSVFMIDLPRRTDQSSEQVQTPFAKELYRFLEAMGCENDMLTGVKNFDFSATERYAFVHSIGGMTYDSEAKTGYTALMDSINHFKLQTTKELRLDIAASSIGSLNDEYLKYIHGAARGQPFTGDETVKSSRTAPKPFAKTDSPTDIKENYRIYFPTHDTVASSTGGTENGGTVCLQRKWYEGNNTFPRFCFRDYRSKRVGMLSHNKIIYARGLNQNGEKVAWGYVGSANLSESAWGKLSWDRGKRDWKMNCRNWECGVLAPVLGGKGREVEVEKPEEKKFGVVDEGGDAETESEGEGTVDGNVREEGKGKEKDKEERSGSGKEEIPDMNVFEGILDLCFEYPGMEYEGKQPWYFME